MSATTNIFGLWYKTSGIQDAVITVPLLELIILLLILTLCQLLRLARTGLIVAFLFAYRWGWIFYFHNNFLNPKMENFFLTGYIIFGILTLALTIIAMTLSSRYAPGE